MELVPRYLDAVRRYLPKSTQADVIEELSDSIQSQIEEKEAGLGRPLNADEENAILKTYGHPLLAASRYRPHQQLIGPALYPFYVNSLKIVLLIALSVSAVATVVLGITSGDALAAAARAWGAIWGTLFSLVGIVTVIFAAIERFGPKDFARKWDPRSLPAATETQRVPRASSTLELVFNLLFAAWLLNIPGIRHIADYATLGGAAAQLYVPFKLWPWWHQMLPALLVATLAHAAVNSVNLVRPDWFRARAGTMIVTHGFLFVVLCLILRQRTFVAVADGVNHAAQYADAANVLNGVVFIGLIGFAVINLVMIAVNVRTLLQRTNRSFPNPTGNAQAPSGP
ncbi:MAG: hypothetical protein M3Z41_09455 [Candidatus Eremiobacteraeota bacterium]|nr:hypothetical protein [Candidatus Eremiobacteraeota bacterium]